MALLRDAVGTATGTRVSADDLRSRAYAEITGRVTVCVATVIRVDGEYETSVARAREDARMNAWHLVSSTSWGDFDDALPRRVMNAYMVMVEQALEQLPDPDDVTHVFVGSIAAAIFLGFAERRPLRLPRFVVVEPVEADCLPQTTRAGHPTPSADPRTVVLFGGEGATDPGIYRELVGATPDEVFESQLLTSTVPPNRTVRPAWKARRHLS